MPEFSASPLGSIPLYALAGFGKDDVGTEAALKYYLLGAFSGIVMLAGVTLLFGAGGATGYPEIKLAGASGVIVAITMTFGNFAAFFQDNVRRLLAYSTISQVGYLLMAVVVATRSDWAQPSLLVYLAAYALTNLGAFAVVCALPQATTISDYCGLFRTRPWLAIVLVVCLLGLVGTPPTPVFVGKLAVFTAAVDGGFTWLAIVAAINTVVSVFYYLRWIAPTVRTDVVRS